MTTPKAATPAPRSFPAVFWTANVMELFERAAYYGMNSVLAIYLSNSTDRGGLGFSEESIGFLQGIIYALTYVVPIVGGALADRYGYRRMLLVAFSLHQTLVFASLFWRFLCGGSWSKAPVGCAGAGRDGRTTAPVTAAQLSGLLS